MFCKKNISVFVYLFITCMLLCFFGGCNQRQQKSDLFVGAVMLAEAGKHEMAVEKLNKLVKTNEHFPEAYSLLGQLYQETGDYTKSAASYEKAIKLNPKSSKAYFNLGNVYRIMKKYTQAAMAYGKSCEINPDYLEVYINAAKCYTEINNYKKALMFTQRVEQIGQNRSI